MPGDDEVPIGMSQWIGVNQEDEPTRLPSNQLQKCQNFFPAPTYSLRKRPGTAAFITWATIGGHAPLGCTSMIRAIDPSGNLYLYGYVQHSDRDRLQVSLNGAAPTEVVNDNFLVAQGTGRLLFMNGTLYAGNGIDPINRVPLASSATQLKPAALGNDTGQTAVLAAATFNPLPTGTYSYRWCVYDTASQSYPFIAPVETVIVSGVNYVTFTAPQAGAPATVLTGTQKWHLFVAFANQPIEFAFDQTASGLAAAATFTMVTVDASTTPVPVPSTLTRNANMLVSHRGRMFQAGDTNALRSVTATNVLLPGNEQTLFNLADFWPANAVLNVDDTVTGIGIASQSTTGQSPSAPFVVTTKAQTFMLIGDIINDPNAAFFRVSKRVGCVAYPTMVNTPIGLIMLGAESVYLVSSLSTEPLDIGWPIEPTIRALTASQQAGAIAAYHRGFYKLCLAVPGGTTNQQEWWLDLRPRMRGAVTSFPSWWGPMMTGAPLTAIATSPYESGGADVAFGAVAGTGTVVLLHQPGAFLDNGVAYQSSVVTARLTWGSRFLRKRVKRVRAIAQVGAPVSMPTTVRIDQNQNVTSTLAITQQTGGVWDVGVWDVAVWGSDIFQEADTQTGPNPIALETQGQSMEVQIDHTVAQDVIISDIEIRAQIIKRPVG